MIYQILLTSLWIWGFYYATRVQYSLIELKFTQKEILWPIKWYGDMYLPEWLRKPLYDCPMCMASAHSLLLSLFFGIDYTIILIVTMTCGLNYIISRVFPYSE